MSVETPDSLRKPERERLLAEFPIPTFEQWRAAAVDALKGAPFEKKLLTPTPEGITLQPIYRREDVTAIAARRELPGFGSHVRGGRAAGPLGAGWRVSQELRAATPAQFNAIARADLERGQTELNVTLDRATARGCDPDEAAPAEVGAGGLSLATLADAEQAFAGISLEKAALYLRSGASALPAAALIFALLRQRGLKPAAWRGCIAGDPLGTIAADGELPVSLKRAYHEMAAVTRFALRHAPELQTIAVQAQAYHDSGASAVQELGFALATGVEYLREMRRRDLEIDEVAGRVRMALGSGANFFMEVAKFRAARQVWSQAVRALGGSAGAAQLHLHVQTSRWNKTICDAHTNILRGTTEAFAAVVGGCSGLHVDAFDAIVREPDEFSRRIARNTQIILGEECDLSRVVDPAGGSYYVEWLTDQVARGAWSVFQEIEKAGGMAQALAQGLPQRMVATTAAGRADAVAKRRTVIVGTNQYANPREALPEGGAPANFTAHEERGRTMTAFRQRSSGEAATAVRKDFMKIAADTPHAMIEALVDAFVHGATLGEAARSLRAGDQPPAKITPMPVGRAAAPFERLRLASAQHRAATGRAPLVFQANIGPSRMYRARADWTAGFFGVGGFEVLADRDFKNDVDAAEAAITSGARLVVITALDETYSAVVEPLARAIKAKDAGIVVLVAGAAKENEAAWRAAGVDEFVNVATNALECLTQLLNRIGVLS